MSASPQEKPLSPEMEQFRQRSCVGKIRMIAWKAQLMAAERGDGIEAYYCRFCTWWHIGHPPYWAIEGKKRPPK